MDGYGCHLDFAQKRPYLLTGWFWFLGMLVPMIGLVQVGSPPRADRYTYLPAIGIFIVFTWGIAELLRLFHFDRRIVAIAAALLILALSLQTYGQVGYWQTSETLWRHAVDVTTGNHIAYNSLGNAFLEQGKLDEAVAQYRRALTIKPNLAPVEGNLGNALLRQAHIDEAM